MTLLEVIDSARKILKDKLDPARVFPDNSSSFLEDGEMTDWYNNTQLEVQGLLGQTFENWFVTATSIDLVAGTEEYTMPANILRIIRVEDNGDSSAPLEIYPMGFNDKDSYYPRVDVNRSGLSDVQFYAIKGNSLILRPRPSVTKASGIKVFYSKMAPASTSASTCSVIPNQYHELLMWGVVENGLIKQEATAEAMAAILGRRNRLIDNMMNSGENRQVQRSRKVKQKKWR